MRNYVEKWSFNRSHLKVYNQSQQVSDDVWRCFYGWKPPVNTLRYFSFLYFSLRCFIAYWKFKENIFKLCLREPCFGLPACNFSAFSASISNFIDSLPRAVILDIYQVILNVLYIIFHSITSIHHGFFFLFSFSSQRKICFHHFIRYLTADSGQRRFIYIDDSIITSWWGFTLLMSVGKVNP